MLSELDLSFFPFVVWLYSSLHQQVDPLHVAASGNFRSSFWQLLYPADPKNSQSHWTNSRYRAISAQPICQRWVYQSGLFQLQVIGNLNSNSLGLGHLSIPTNQWQMSSMQQGREKQANVYINGPAYGLSLQLLPEAMAMQWGLVGGNVAEMGS